MRLPMKPGALPESTAIFLSRFAELHHRGDDVFAGLRAANDLKQAHDVGRAEEMHADDVASTGGRVGHFVNVQARSVAGKDGAGLSDGINFFEGIYLNVDILVDGLNNNVGVLKVRVVSGSGKQLHASVNLSFAHATALHLNVVVALDDAETRVPGLRCSFQQW